MGGLLLVVALLAIVHGGLCQQPVASNAGARCMNILELITEDDDLQAMTAVVFESGMDSVLESASGTLFAPSNEAFDAYLKQLGQSPGDFLDNKDGLVQLLSYHVAPSGAYKAATLKNQQRLPTLLTARLPDTATVAARNGTQLLVEKTTRLVSRTQWNTTFDVAIRPVGGGPSAKVVRADIPTCQFTVHIIDRVLVPGAGPSVAPSQASPSPVLVPSPALAPSPSVATSPSPASLPTPSPPPLSPPSSPSPIPSPSPSPLSNPSPSPVPSPSPLPSPSPILSPSPSPSPPLPSPSPNPSAQPPSSPATSPSPLPSPLLQSAPVSSPLPSPSSPLPSDIPRILATQNPPPPPPAPPQVWAWDQAASLLTSPRLSSPAVLPPSPQQSSGGPLLPPALNAMPINPSPAATSPSHSPIPARLSPSPSSSPSPSARPSPSPLPALSPIPASVPTAASPRPAGASPSPSFAVGALQASPSPVPIPSKSPAHVAAPAQPTCETALEVAQSDPAMSMFVAAAKSSGLAYLLTNTSATGTVFAPTNEAFASFAKGLGLKQASDLLTSQPTLVSRLMAYHYVPGDTLFVSSMKDSQKLSTWLSAATKSMWQTTAARAATQLEVNKMSNRATQLVTLIPSGDTRESRVVQSDFLGCKTVLHKVDRVLVPDLQLIFAA